MIKIVSDSSGDFPKEIVEKHGIELVPFRVTLDGETYYRENIDITLDEFYTRLKNEDLSPRTSLPPTQDYYEVFKRNLEAGYEVICFNLTSKFSGSYQSAVGAMNLIKEEMPEAPIHVMDTRLCTATQGALVLEACRMRDAGMNAVQILENCERLRENSLIYCTVDSLKYLQKGGRIGKAAALAGNLLNIKPIIYFEDGELKAHSKIRGRKKTVNEVIRLATEGMKKLKKPYYAMVLHSMEQEEAEEVKRQLESSGFPVNYPLVCLGVTIGAHIGPTVIGVGFLPMYESLEK